MINSSNKEKELEARIVACKKAHDELRQKLVRALNYNDYSYPESENFSVSGVYVKDPDMEVFKELCEYAAVQGDTDYDGKWSGADLYSFLKDKTVKYVLGNRYYISLSFGGLPPVLAVLSYLSVYADIQSLEVTFTRDKWEARGDYSSESRVGIKFEDGDFTVGLFSNDTPPVVEKKVVKKENAEGYKSDRILPSRDMRSRDYDVKKINANEYSVTAKNKKHKVMERDGYFWCDCGDFIDEPKNCKHIVAVKRLMNDPFVIYKAPNFRIEEIPSSGTSQDDRYTKYIEQLKEAYKGVKTYTLQRLKDEQPNVPFAGLSHWIKKQYGMSAIEYFKSIGILLPEIYYELAEDKVEPEALRGKKCCVRLTPSGIRNFEQIVTRLGAEIVSCDHADIDYLFINVNLKYIKEPLSDYDGEITELLQNRDDGKVQFGIISHSFIRENMELIKQMDDEITDANNIVFSIKNDIQESDIPTYKSDKLYWSLRYFKNWFGASGGKIRGDLADNTTEKELDDRSLTERTFALVKAFYERIHSEKVEKYINRLANREEWIPNRDYVIAPLGYIESFSEYTAIIGRITENNVITVSIKTLMLAKHYEDDDYLLSTIPLTDIPKEFIEAVIGDDGNGIMNGNANEFTIEEGVLLKCHVEKEEIVVPEGVTQIANDVFSGFKSTKKIILPNGLKKIGDHAFFHCHNLASIDIPSTVTSIGESAFSCSGIEYIVLPPKIKKIAKKLFFWSAIKESVIPDGVKTIGEEAFYFCSKLQKVVFPDSVQKIERRAFHDCNKLAQVNVPPSARVEYNAFGMCGALADKNGFVILNGVLYESPAMYKNKTVIIPDGVVELNQATPGGVPGTPYIDEDGNVITQYCKHLVIPKSVTKYAPGAFRWSRLQTIVTYSHHHLGPLVFTDCESLKKITIPRDVEVHENLFSFYPEENDKAMKRLCIEYLDEETAQEKADVRDGEGEREAQEEVKRKEQEESKCKERKESTTKARASAEQKEQKEAEKATKKASEEAKCEEVIASIAAKSKESSSRYTNAEIVTMIESNGISVRRFDKYVSETYGKSMKAFFEDLGVLKTPRSDFNELITILRQRYENRPKVSDVTALIAENADIDFSIIANNAKKFTGMTARELLLHEGILVGHASADQEDLFVGVLHTPGNEPENIKRRLDALFAKLDEAYPDKVISGLNRDHKKWGETVTELYRLLGYANSKSFLMAYGYTVEDNKGGRTANKSEDIIAELKRRYPDGSPYTNVAQLKAANSDLAPKIKSLENAAKTLFGTSLKDYLIDQNILTTTATT